MKRLRYFSRFAYPREQTRILHSEERLEWLGSAVLPLRNYSCLIRDHTDMASFCSNKAMIRNQDREYNDTSDMITQTCRVFSKTDQATHALLSQGLSPGHHRASLDDVI